MQKMVTTASSGWNSHFKEGGNKNMVFDLTFEEAIDILKNKVGWVQGENFDEHEYFSIGQIKKYFHKKCFRR